ncbi:helix-turn-helix domain-containing protein [Haloferax sp. S1W]|uniref:helix-turn-helix domain-containing protein n=1 Tax=Haloferax sp. S1W TaxID=3377110 RepID=UPI0037C5BAB2
MRYATLDISWEDSQLHPLDDAVTTAPDIRIEATDYINPVGDGTYVELARFQGPTDRVREVLSQTEAVLAFDVSEGTGHTYVHYESAPLMDALLDVVFDHRVVLTWPVEFIDYPGKHGIRTTVIGTTDALGEVTSNLPESVRVELVRTGEYAGPRSERRSLLTEAQRELLDAAVRAGYYEVPRRTTHESLADEFGVTPGTISDRLQRIEATLMTNW